MTESHREKNTSVEYSIIFPEWNGKINQKATKKVLVKIHESKKTFFSIQQTNNKSSLEKFIHSITFFISEYV